jgi:hypothetical protein
VPDKEQRNINHFLTNETFHHIFSIFISTGFYSTIIVYKVFLVSFSECIIIEGNKLIEFLFYLDKEKANFVTRQESVFRLNFWH